MHVVFVFLSLNYLDIKMRRNSTRFVKLLVIAFAFLIITVVIYKTLIAFDDADSTDNSAATNSKMRAFVDRLRGRAIDIHSADVASDVGGKSVGNFFNGRLTNADGQIIDWHDYAYIEKERKMQGLGERGVASKLSADLEPKRQEIFDKNGFNGLLSDLISVNRSVADIRHKG